MIGGGGKEGRRELSPRPGPLAARRVSGIGQSPAPQGGCAVKRVWANSSWSTRSSEIKQWWKVLSGVRLKYSLLQHEKEADRPNWTNIKLFYLAFLG